MCNQLSAKSQQYSTPSVIKLIYSVCLITLLSGVLSDIWPGAGIIPIETYSNTFSSAFLLDVAPIFVKIACVTAVCRDFGWSTVVEYC